MIDYHKTLVTALNKILPTYYENFLHSGVKTPCISYIQLNDTTHKQGDTVGYSRLSYQIKVWGTNLEQIQKYSLQVAETMRILGWERTSALELSDPNSSMIQKVMTYDALVHEQF